MSIEKNDLDIFYMYFNQYIAYVHLSQPDLPFCNILLTSITPNLKGKLVLRRTIHQNVIFNVKSAIQSYSLKKIKNSTLYCAAIQMEQKKKQASLGTHRGLKKHVIFLVVLRIKALH